MKYIAFSMFLVLAGCADMPAYKNFDAAVYDVKDYVVFETESHAGRKSRSWADGKPDLNIVHIDNKKVGDIAFSTYYYKNDSPQQAILTPGKHTIELEYKIPTKYLRMTFEFEGVAGQKIIAKSAYTGLDSIRLWLEDQDTNEEVGKRVK